MPITTEHLRALVEPLVVGRGYDLDDVTISGSGPDTELTVVVDRDGGTDLDDIAVLTRDISTALDDAPGLPDEPYLLEVTSPGVDRPLTLPRHWRRALGRKVALDLKPQAPGETKGRRVTGRVGPLDGDAATITIVANENGRLLRETLHLNSITKAVVQVDFSRPSPRELEMCGLDADEIARRRDSAAHDVTAPDLTNQEHTTN